MPLWNSARSHNLPSNVLLSLSSHREACSWWDTVRGWNILHDSHWYNLTEKWNFPPWANEIFHLGLLENVCIHLPLFVCLCICVPVSVFCISLYVGSLCLYMSLWVSFCVFVHLCLCVSLCGSIFFYVSFWVYASLSLSVYVCLFWCVCVRVSFSCRFLCVHVCICIPVCMSMCVNVHMHLCVCLCVCSSSGTQKRKLRGGNTHLGDVDECKAVWCHTKDVEW